MRILILFILLLGLTSCHKPSPNTLVVGTIAGPETDLLKTAKKVAYKQYGVKIKIVEFNDYALPNVALQDQSLDANVFQHLPYLQAATQAHGYDFEVIGKTFIFPIGLYSKKIKSLDQIPERGLIAIPNDPSNEARALLLLEKAGLIKLTHNKTSNNPLHEIISNPKSLKIKELDAAQLPRILADADAAIINSNFAKPAGLSLTHDTIYVEGKDSPYAVVVVSRCDSIKKQQLEYLVKALHSSEVRKKAAVLFDNAAVPAYSE